MKTSVRIADIAALKQAPTELDQDFLLLRARTPLLLNESFRGLTQSLCVGHGGFFPNRFHFTNLRTIPHHAFSILAALQNETNL
jgi:hypothetical protein